jgi:hypothetical protein
MLSSRRRSLVVFLFLTVTLSFPGESVLSAGEIQPVKAVRDPHLVHFEIGRDIPPIGFAVDQIKEWPGLIKSFRSRLNDLPISRETKFLINHLMPAVVNEDEKKVIVGELNKLLLDKELYARVTGKMAFSSETQRLLAQYRHAPTEENLRWANRRIINDLIPETPVVSVETGRKYNKLRGINCLTCHESWKERKPSTDLHERARSDEERLEQMVAAQKITPPPARAVVDKVVPDDDFLRQHETLKKFVVRSDKRQNPSLIEAVRPEDPYTFKPLLKRLVCLDCHGQDWEVDRIEHPDGKSHRIKFFYGPIAETLNETHKD